MNRNDLKKAILGKKHLEIGMVQFIVKTPSRPDRPHYRHLFKDCITLIRWKSEIKEITGSFLHYPLCPICGKRFASYD